MQALTVDHGPELHNCDLTPSAAELRQVRPQLELRVY